MLRRRFAYCLVYRSSTAVDGVGEAVEEPEHPDSNVHGARLGDLQGSVVAAPLPHGLGGHAVEGRFRAVVACQGSVVAGFSVGWRAWRRLPTGWRLRGRCSTGTAAGGAFEDAVEDLLLSSSRTVKTPGQGGGVLQLLRVAAI